MRRTQAPLDMETARSLFDQAYEDQSYTDEVVTQLMSRLTHVQSPD